MSPRIEEPASELRLVVPVRTGPKEHLGEACECGTQSPGAGLGAESVLLCGNVHAVFRKALPNSSVFVLSPGLLLLAQGIGKEAGWEKKPLRL